MSKPLKSIRVAKVPTKAVYAIRAMLAIAFFASIFVIMQSCSGPKKSGLMRFADGALEKMQVLDKPPAMPQMTFKTNSGNDMILADFQGQVILVNIWATWCAPCVAEIPSLDALQAIRGGTNFSVITISMDRHIDDAAAFFKAKNITNLKLYHDPTYSFSAKLDVQGIPISVFYDVNGQEIARIAGEVDWQSKEVSALMDSILNQ